MSELTDSQAIEILEKNTLKVYLHILPAVNSIIFFQEQHDYTVFKVKGYKLTRSGIKVKGHFKGKATQYMYLDRFTRGHSKTYNKRLDVLPLPLTDFLQTGIIKPYPKPYPKHLKDEEMASTSMYLLLQNMSVIKGNNNV